MFRIYIIRSLLASFFTPSNPSKAPLLVGVLDGEIPSATGFFALNVLPFWKIPGFWMMFFFLESDGAKL